MEITKLTMTRSLNGH